MAAQLLDEAVMTDDTPTPPPIHDAEREAVPYQPPRPFLREHKRAPMASRDGLQAWLGDEIAYLENTILTRYGEGSLSAFKRVATETASIPDHTVLTTRVTHAETAQAAIQSVLDFHGIGVSGGTVNWSLVERVQIACAAAVDESAETALAALMAENATLTADRDAALAEVKRLRDEQRKVVRDIAGELPNAFQRHVGALWMKTHGRAVDDDAFVAAALYRMMRLAIIEPNASQLAEARAALAGTSEPQAAGDGA